MASIFDRIEDNKVEYITWEDVVREGFTDSQTISPWYRYSIEISRPTIGPVYETMVTFFPERKANPYIGPDHDEPSRLQYRTELDKYEYKMITNPTTEDLKMVMAIIRRVTAINPKK